MKVFQQREIREAILFSESGGQALHMMDGSYAYLRADTPNCFKGRGQIAHLFDRDRARLIGKAKKLGVRIIKVERDGTLKQHIDLCGAPLQRALKECNECEQEAVQRELLSEDIKP